MSAKILVVEDEPAIADAVGYALAEAGYEVETVGDGDDAIAAARDTRYDLMILDMLLHGTQGMDVCRTLRSESDLPIVMLTAREAEADRVGGLEVGADDYVTKPFSPRELVARVRSVLRRTAPQHVKAERLVFDDLTIDATTREVTKAGESLRLTAKEFDLLWFLARHPRQVFSRDQLMDRVWGYSAALDTGTVTVHVRRLREKIEDDPARPAFLQTVWGVGYRFAPPPAPERGHHQGVAV